MSTFKKRFEKMVQQLKSHPLVEVYNVHIAPPADKKTIAQAEAVIGQPLPKEIRDFYAAHDGVFLEWGLKDQEYESKTEPFEFPDYGQPPGCINFLPISLAMSPDWESGSHVNEVMPEQQELLFGEVPDPQPAVRAVIIDNFSKYNHGDLIFGVGKEPLVIVSTDHGADMDSSDFLPFSTYLDAVLALFGSNRYNAIGCGWSGDPKRVDKWTKQPTLDEVVAEAEEES